jgi:phage terminase small subunit
VRELARLGLVNAQDVINAADATVRDDASRDDTAAIASVKVKVIPTPDGDIIEREVKLFDKPKTLELLGKHLGMFTDNLKLSGSVDVGSEKLDRILEQLHE